MTQKKIRNHALDNAIDKENKVTIEEKNPVY